MTDQKDTQHYRILIVDDLAHQRIAIREAIGAVVPNCGFKEAESLEDAEKDLAEQKLPFDLAVVDQSLVPGDTEDKKGLALVGVIKEILQRHSQTKVIIVTAYPRLEAACAAYEAGANAYLSKLDLEYTSKLQEKVRELIDLRDMRGRLRQRDEAQRAANQAFAQHHEEWTKRYRGQIVAVRGGEVVVAANNPHTLWEKLSEYTTTERAQMGIIEIPETGENNV